MAAVRGGVGPLIRERRVSARRSQLDLALDVGVSARHLSFVELGKARPSPELLILIANRLGVPAREQNDWLIAAGHAPRHAETPLDAASMATVRRSLQAFLDAHEPFPAVAIDRCWTVQAVERRVGLAGRRHLGRGAGRPDQHLPDLAAPRRLRPPHPQLRPVVGLPPAPARPHRAPHPVGRGRGAGGRDRGVARHRAAGHVVALDAAADDPVMPWVVEHSGVELSMFTVMATLGTPVDLTLTEMTVELFLAADRRRRSSPPGRPNSGAAAAVASNFGGQRAQGSGAEQAPHVGRLAGVLEAVVGHAHQPDAERHGRVPAPVDDAVEVVLGDALEERAGPGVDGVEVVEQRRRRSSGRTAATSSGVWP